MYMYTCKCAGVITLPKEAKNTHTKKIEVDKNEKNAICMFGKCSSTARNNSSRVRQIVALRAVMQPV